mmetsp:Transcript_31883/g.69774  ORF Transcript_31883/g.69774 Transcript_31883/m.69774 type:complete len:207 (-) Transcript_31883:64-684(-)
MSSTATNFSNRSSVKKELITDWYSPALAQESKACCEARPSSRARSMMRHLTSSARLRPPWSTCRAAGPATTSGAPSTTTNLAMASDTGSPTSITGSTTRVRRRSTPVGAGPVSSPDAAPLLATSSNAVAMSTRIRSSGDWAPCCRYGRIASVMTWDRTSSKLRSRSNASTQLCVWARDNWAEANAWQRSCIDTFCKNCSAATQTWG